MVLSFQNIAVAVHAVVIIFGNNSFTIPNASISTDTLIIYLTIVEKEKVLAFENDAVVVHPIQGLHHKSRHVEVAELLCLELLVERLERAVLLEAGVQTFQDGGVLREVLLVQLWSTII